MLSDGQGSNQGHSLGYSSVNSIVKIASDYKPFLIIVALTNYIEFKGEGNITENSKSMVFLPTLGVLLSLPLHIFGICRHAHKKSSTALGLNLSIKGK